MLDFHGNIVNDKGNLKSGKNSYNMIMEMESVNSGHEKIPDNKKIFCLNKSTIKALQEDKSSNRLLFIINSIYLTIVHFCKTSRELIKYSYSLSEYHKKPEIFVDEYLKRYKAFIDVSIYLNDYLENLNVIMNYTYEYFWENYQTFPKFSILRLMVILIYNFLGYCLE